MRGIRLNLGCGCQLPKGWTNVDYALGARLMRIPFFRTVNKKFHLFNMEWDDNIFLHDLTTPFPWSDNSVDAIYSSHTLEHLSREQGRKFLRQCHRVLRSGGVIRIVVPDLSCMVRRYMEGELKAEDFVEALGVLYPDSGGRLKNRLAPFVQFPHKCMYDTPALISSMSEIGFEAKGMGAFESVIDDIREIETEGRTRDAVIVEGVKA